MAVTPKFVKELVETRTGFEDISIKSRKRPLPDLRFMAYDLCKRFCEEKITLTQIGDAFDVDHSTVLHGLKMFDNIKTQPKLNKKTLEDYFYLTAEIREEINRVGIKKVLKSVEEVENEYRIKNILLEDKYRKVVNSLARKLRNLRHRAIFQEIASLDEETLDNFEQRAKAFLIMNKNKV